MNTNQTRLFVLRRDHDVTGVSGPGDVADGVQWPDGTVTLRWRERPSTSVWDSLELMLSVHGHDGATRAVWLDEQTPAARAAALREAYEIAHTEGMRLNALEAEIGVGPYRGALAVAYLLRKAISDEPQHDRAASSCSNPDHACPTCGDCTHEHPLTAALERVRQVHSPASDWARKPFGCHHNGEHTAPCRSCKGECWPCPTLTAFEGTEQPTTEERQTDQGPLTGIEVRDPCPHCNGGPLVPRTLMDDHVRRHHPEQLDNGVELAREALLARIGEDQADAVDRLIRAVERRNYCDLPHEMEA